MDYAATDDAASDSCYRLKIAMGTAPEEQSWKLLHMPEGSTVLEGVGGDATPNTGSRRLQGDLWRLLN